MSKRTRASAGIDEPPKPAPKPAGNGAAPMAVDAGAGEVKDGKDAAGNPVGAPAAAPQGLLGAASPAKKLKPDIDLSKFEDKKPAGSPAKPTWTPPPGVEIELPGSSAPGVVTPQITLQEFLGEDTKSDTKAGPYPLLGVGPPGNFTCKVCARCGDRLNYKGLCFNGCPATAGTCTVFDFRDYPCILYDKDDKAEPVKVVIHADHKLVTSWYPWLDINKWKHLTAQQRVETFMPAFETPFSTELFLKIFGAGKRSYTAKGISSGSSSSSSGSS